MAIIEYLDEVLPAPPLLPGDPLGRARVRALAQIIGCDIHPLNNLRVIQPLMADYGADHEAVTKWFSTWVHAGFHAFERRLQESATGDYCHGDTPGLADICLFSQVLNNVRFDVDMSAYPTVMRIHNNCERLDAFQKSIPTRQPDAPQPDAPQETKK
jgi:maleylpyruvate isomerase